MELKNTLSQGDHHPANIVFMHVCKRQLSGNFVRHESRYNGYSRDHIHNILLTIWTRTI